MATQQRLRACIAKPKIFIISDISNEPDDAESLVRYLLYSNEFDTRGLVACTSVWMRSIIHPEDMLAVIDAYDRVVPSLNHHVHESNQYQDGDYFRSILRKGPAMYGKEALEPDVPLSEGARLLIDELERTNDFLWVLCWGGTNVLAQALVHIHDTKLPAEQAELRSKIRVYAISDQDDTAVWIRNTFPDIFYIVSLHGWNHYGNALWTGISGDEFYGFDQGGPNFDVVSAAWIRKNIQIGPLGKAYPDFAFIPEGDTPTFLYLIQNGLGSPENPDWGSWGGRYLPVDGGSHGSHFRHFHDATDRVIGKNGKVFRSNQATIWRWREAFQNDFAARMQWSLTSDILKANHSPVVVVNNSSPGSEALFIDAEEGSSIDLDASASYDPDGDDLTFKWLHYKDVTATNWRLDHDVSDVVFENFDETTPGRRVKARLPENSRVHKCAGLPNQQGQIFHLVLEVTDSGSPQLTTYKRIVVKTLLKS